MLEQSPLEKTRQQEEQQFTWLLGNMADAFLRVNSDWECICVNHQAEEALGTMDDTLLGKTLWEIFPSCSDTTFYQQAREAMHQRTILPFTVAYSPLNRWFTGRFVPFQTGISLFFQDTTSQIHAEHTFHQNEIRTRRLIDSNIIGVIISDSTSILEAQVQEELQRSEKRLHIWIENVADIITILDKEGTILYQSPALERVLGWKPEERIKQNIFSSTLVHPEDRQKKQAFFTELLHSLETTITSTFRMRHKNGSYRFIEARGRNLLASPDIQSIVATYRDVTEREELEQRKDEFISMASHELKTPLTSLKGYTQVLKMELESLALPQMVEDLSVMEHQIDTLIRLINDFLDTSRIKAGKLEYHQEVFALDPFVQQMIKILQRISPYHIILLTGESNTFIAGDRERLGQVLMNLVSNAIKYTPGTKPIEIHISATTDIVTISVQDDGIGIPQEHQQKIFERFYRIPNTIGHSVSGLGMGLYISSEIVQRHNGRIWVESSEGLGSRFSFSLPIVKQYG